MNSATANRFVNFPCGLVEVAPETVFVGAGNTWANGHDRVYTAAQALDGATMDRFIKFEIGYDEKLERAVALRTNPAASRWVDIVQRARRNADAAQIDALITPRSSIIGAELLGLGFTVGEVKAMTYCAGLDADTIATLNA